MIILRLINLLFIFMVLLSCNKNNATKNCNPANLKKVDSIDGYGNDLNKQPLEKGFNLITTRNLGNYIFFSTEEKGTLMINKRTFQVEHVIKTKWVAKNDLLFDSVKNYVYLLTRHQRGLAAERVECYDLKKDTIKWVWGAKEGFHYGDQVKMFNDSIIIVGGNSQFVFLNAYNGNVIDSIDNGLRIWTGLFVRIKNNKIYLFGINDKYLTNACSYCFYIRCLDSNLKIVWEKIVQGDENQVLSVKTFNNKFVLTFDYSYRKVLVSQNGQITEVKGFPGHVNFFNDKIYLRDTVTNTIKVLNQKKETKKCVKIKDLNVKDLKFRNIENKIYAIKSDPLRVYNLADTLKINRTFTKILKTFDYYYLINKNDFSYWFSFCSKTQKTYIYRSPSIME